MGTASWGNEGWTTTFAGGLSLYKNAAKEFQYSKQILKISTSSTSDINNK